MKNYPTLGSQRGMTFLGISSLLIALVVGGKLLFATVPAYLEDRAITSLVEKKFQEKDKKKAYLNMLKAEIDKK